MEDGEEADDFLIGSVKTGEVKAVATDRAPVGRAVVGVRPEAELGGDELPEREFGGSEHFGKRESRLLVHWRFAPMGTSGRAAAGQPYLGSQVSSCQGWGVRRISLAPRPM